MVSDDPAKGLGLGRPEANLTHALKQIIGDPVREVDLVSAYFVPTRAGVEAFTALARRGVTVNILTNSLEATDVAVVHAGYAKWRTELLQGGVSIFELRRLAAYQVLLSHEGEVCWREWRQGQSIRHDVEPGTSFWLRAGVWLMSLLPIEWML